MNLSKSHFCGFGRVDDGRVVSREYAILCADEHADFGAAENDAFGAADLHFGDDSLVFLAGGIKNFPEAEFVENDVVYEFDIPGVGCHNFETCDQEAVLDEVLRHREFGAEEGDFFDVVALDAVGGRIGDVENRDADFFFDLRDEFVHGVGCDDDKVGTGAFKAFGRVRKDFGVPVPIAARQVRFEFGEVHVVHHDLGAVESAECFCDFFVQNFVIGNGAFPAHSTDKSDSLHFTVLL